MSLKYVSFFYKTSRRVTFPAGISKFILKLQLYIGYIYLYAINLTQKMDCRLSSNGQISIERSKAMIYRHSMRIFSFNYNDMYYSNTVFLLFQASL